MARDLKPHKVKTVHHRQLPITIDIMLDKNKLDFFFVVAGEYFRADSVDQLVPVAREKIEEIATVEWQQVIEIAHTVEDGHAYDWQRSGHRGEPRPPHPCKGGAELSFERYERGRFAGAWKLKRKHALDVDMTDPRELQRRERNEGTWLGGHGTTIPYSEKAWLALHAIVAGIHELNAKLTLLLADDDHASALLERMLERMGPITPLLPAFVPYDETIRPSAEQPKRRRSAR